MAYSLECQFLLVWILADVDGVSLVECATQYQLADAILYVGLDSSLQWTGTKLNVVTLGCHQLLCLVGDLNLVTHLVHTLEETTKLNVDDLLDGIEIQLVECDEFIETVQELTRELLAQVL